MTILNSPVIRQPFENNFWNYEIESHTLYSNDTLISTHKALFSGDNFIGIAPTDWEVHQPKSIIPEVHKQLQGIGFEYYGGSDVSNRYITLAYRHKGLSDIQIKPEVDDIICFMFIVRVPNVYGQSFSINLVAERLVCENGMTVKQGTDVSIKVTHRLDTERLLKSFEKQLPKIVQVKNSLASAFEKSTRVRLKSDEVKKILEEVKLAERPTKQILELYENNTMKGSSELTEGTLWGLYNSVTEYFNNNFHSIKNRNSLEEYSKQLESLVYGTRSATISKMTEIVQQRVSCL